MLIFIAPGGPEQEERYIDPDTKDKIEYLLKDGATIRSLVLDGYDQEDIIWVKKELTGQNPLHFDYFPIK